MLDVVAGALDAHVHAVRPGGLARWALLGLSSAVVGWLNFHTTDDVQPVAAALLVLGFAFGLDRPRRASLTALVLFAAVPVSEAMANAAGHHPGHASGPPYETIVALVPTLLGTFAGAGLGRAARE